MLNVKEHPWNKLVHVLSFAEAAVKRCNIGLKKKKHVLVQITWNLEYWLLIRNACRLWMPLVSYFIDTWLYRPLWGWLRNAPLWLSRQKKKKNECLTIFELPMKNYFKLNVLQPENSQNKGKARNICTSYKYDFVLSDYGTLVLLCIYSTRKL